MKYAPVNSAFFKSAFVRSHPCKSALFPRTVQSFAVFAGLDALVELGALVVDRCTEVVVLTLSDAVVFDLEPQEIAPNSRTAVTGKMSHDRRMFLLQLGYSQRYRHIATLRAPCTSLETISVAEIAIWGIVTKFTKVRKPQSTHCAN